MASGRDIEAGKAFVKLYTDNSALVRGLQRAQRRLKAFGAGVAGLGAKVMAAGAMITTPLLASVKVFSSLGDKFDKMSHRTGMGTEALSELAFAAEQSGSDVETLEKTLSRMQRSLYDAGRGLATPNDALKDIGLSIKALEGLSPEQQFAAIAEGISKIADPTKQAGVAMSLLGQSGRKLIPLMKGGAAGIAQLRKEARDLGLSISGEQAAAAAELTDAWNRVKKAVTATVFTIGSALAPMITKTLGLVKTYAVKLSDWVKQNKQLVVTIFKVGVAVTLAGAALVGIGGAIIGFGVVLGSLATVVSAVGTALGVVGTVLGALLSPIGLAVAAVAGLAGYFLYASGAAGKAASWIGQKFSELAAFAREPFGGIADALASGNITLAANVLWTSLQVAWQKGVATLKGYWLDLKFATAKIFTETWYGVQAIFVETIAKLKTICTEFTTGFINRWRGAQHAVTKGLTRVILKVQGMDEDIIQKTLRTEDRRFAGEKDQREQEKQDRLAAIKKDSGSKLADIGQRRGDAIGALEGMQGAEQRRLLTKLEKARKAYKDALASARQAREESGGGLLGALGDQLSGLDLGGAVSKASGAKGPIGAFEAAAAMRLGQQNRPQQRMEQLMQETVRHQAEMVRLMKTGKLVYVE